LLGVLASSYNSGGVAMDSLETIKGEQATDLLVKYDIILVV
jgi:hypothetical protein